MNSQRYLVALMLFLGVAFFFAAYKAIDNTVAEQSRVQQQAVSPVYQLVNEELLKPLHIAETFASAVDLGELTRADAVDETRLLQQLKKLEQDLGLVFFVASEQTRKQYLSSGRTIDLIEGQVAWYFEARAEDKDFFADLGQVGDVHLYFDVKVYGREREFLGYVGVGKRIQRFIDTFNEHKANYGYDFLFVNDKDQIILTSFPDLVVTGAYIPTLASLDWFDRSDLATLSHDSEIIQIDQDDYLITEFPIEALGWRLLLLSPLEARQAQITRSFVTNALAAVVIVTLLASTFVYLMLLNRRNLQQKIEIDPLTGLPNRAFLHRHYEQLQRADATLCAVIIDLDHFKAVNDTHGHEAGDRVLKVAADAFRQDLREDDVVGRWGGEEFVMLLPADSIELGATVAERSRQRLEAMSIDTRLSRVSVTASFGVAFGAVGREPLDVLLARADEALYKAKRDGRNLVRLSAEEQAAQHG